jgi:peptidoglycan/LPS O-acetylase OafA/YrhL
MLQPGLLSGTSDNAWLHGLRSIAALIVVVGHASSFGMPIIPGLSSTAKAGVWVFFMLSAYLLVGKLIEQFELGSSLSLTIASYATIGIGGYNPIATFAAYLMAAYPRIAANPPDLQNYLFFFALGIFFLIASKAVKLKRRLMISVIGAALFISTHPVVLMNRLGLRLLSRSFYPACYLVGHCVIEISATKPVI